MNKATLKEIIKEFQEGDLPQILPRETELPLDSSKIIAVVGPRRSGKTYLLFWHIKKLLERGVDIRCVLYLNFEDPRLLPAEAKDLELVLEAYRELYPEIRFQKAYLFFDEIHNVRNWELGVRRIYDTRKFQVFLSGSSSKFLSSDVATQLRGRGITFELLPFSFREILSSKGLRVTKDVVYSPERFEVQKIFQEYLTYGGFPEVVLEKSSGLKIRTLKEYLETMFLKDLIERYHIRNQAMLRELIKYLMTNAATIFSANAFYRWIKTVYPITKRTLLNYLDYLEDAKLFFLLRRYSFSIKEQALSPRKTYVVDVGLRNAFGFKFSEDYGRTIENVVFIALLQRRAKNPLTEVHFWRDDKKREADFLVSEGGRTKEIIQVCADPSDFQVKARELSGLMRASSELKCNHLTVVTGEYEGEEKVQKRKVRFVPAWKWLLQAES